MGFLKPKVPKTPPPPNPAISPIDAAASEDITGLADQPGSLINTSAQGLKRKPETQRVSLIGG